jgi:hypothetical protein
MTVEYGDGELQVIIILPHPVGASKNPLDEI